MSTCKINIKEEEEGKIVEAEVLEEASKKKVEDVTVEDCKGCVTCTCCTFLIILIYVLGAVIHYICFRKYQLAYVRDSNPDTAGITSALWPITMLATLPFMGLSSLFGLVEPHLQ